MAKPLKKTYDPYAFLLARKIKLYLYHTMHRPIVKGNRESFWDKRVRSVRNRSPDGLENKA
jgi:hypothetical protein